VADTGDSGSDDDPVDEAVGPGVSDDWLGSGEVSADRPGLGLVEANDDDGEADELAQPARRDRQTSDVARSLSTFAAPLGQPV